MAKKSSIEKNNRRGRLAKKYAAKRTALKAIAKNQDLPLEDRMDAQFKLNALPRNSSPTRYRNRCELTGRSRGYYRKFRLCRNMLRELGSFGQIPGLTKSSW